MSSKKTSKKNKKEFFILKIPTSLKLDAKTVDSIAEAFIEATGKGFMFVPDVFDVYTNMKLTKL